MSLSYGVAPVFQLKIRKHDFLKRKLSNFVYSEMVSWATKVIVLISFHSVSIYCLFKNEIGQNKNKNILLQLQQKCNS